MTTYANPHYRPVPGFRRLYIFGAGGFGREVAWLAQQSWESLIELQFLVDRPEYLRASINDIPVRLLGDEEVGVEARFVVAVGNPALRRRVTAACLAAGHMPAILIHPRAEMSHRIDIGEGSVLCAGNTITTNVAIGPHVHINLDCTIGHDVAIGEFSTLSPGVHVSGNVTIGSGVFIGTGANIIPGTANAPLVIGDGAVVAAGACVTQSVAPGAMVAGVPAVRKR